MKEMVDIGAMLYYNDRRFTERQGAACSCAGAVEHKESGVWLSLARAPGLGPGGRRFESCHPDESNEVENSGFF